MLTEQRKLHIILMFIFDSTEVNPITWGLILAKIHMGSVDHFDKKLFYQIIQLKYFIECIHIILIGCPTSPICTRYFCPLDIYVCMHYISKLL